MHIQGDFCLYYKICFCLFQTRCMSYIFLLLLGMVLGVIYNISVCHLISFLFCSLFLQGLCVLIIHNFLSVYYIYILTKFLKVFICHLLGLLSPEIYNLRGSCAVLPRCGILLIDLYLYWTFLSIKM